MKKYAWIVFSAIALAACKNESREKPVASNEDYEAIYDKATTFFQPISSLELETPDANKVKLGKYLFFDTRLSGEGNISCNSCHNLKTYGVDNERFSPGDAPGTFGGRNSPTVFHAALHKMQFWDGRAADVEEQAGGPILNPLEHNIKDEQQLVDRLKEVELYQDLFAKAYGGDNPITFANLTNAIGAFERTLIPEGRFDEYLAGNQDALNDQEKRGLRTFIDSGCITCHSGPALGGQMLQKFGLFSDYWMETDSEDVDLGLYEISEREAEKYFFKVPGLRNITHTAPYFHDGSIDDLNQAVWIMGKLQRNVDLSDQEIEDIVAFLSSLSSDIPEGVKQNPFEEQ